MLDLAAHINALYEIAIGADAIAGAIAYIIQQSGDVDVNQIIVPPTLQ